MNIKKIFSSSRLMIISVWVLTIGLFLWGWSHYYFQFRERMAQTRANSLTSGTNIQAITAANLKAAMQESNASLILVNVWATWCEPCRVEMREFVRVAQTFHDKKVEVFLVSADEMEDLKNVQHFLGEQGVGFPSFIIRERADTFMKELAPDWNGALPATFFFKADGTLLEKKLGVTTFEELAGRIRSLLGAS